LAGWGALYVHCRWRSNCYREVREAEPDGQEGAAEHAHELTEEQEEVAAVLQRGRRLDKAVQGWRNAA
jgi:hypothetical protein